jgi:hypothetical protein
MVIYVIGFIGSDRMTAARAASEEYGIPLYDLNAEIEERDGRSIRRMVITMGEHELRNKEYETLTAILKECGEPVNPAETADQDLPAICSRGKDAAAAGARENPACEYSAVICCGDDIILDPMSADLVRAGKVIIADDPDAAESPEDAAACLEAMLERAVNDETTHYAFLMDPDKDAVRKKFMKLYEQRRPLYAGFRK